MKPWLDDEDVPRDVRRLLEAGTSTAPLGGEALERSRRRVANLAAVPVAAGAFFWAQQFALGAGLGVAVSVSVAAAGGVFSRPPVPPSAAPASVNPTPNAVRPALENAEQPGRDVVASETAAAAREVSAPSAAPAPTLRTQESVTAEAALLEQARRSLASDPALALATLDEHARRFAHGTLHVEREVLAVEALMRASRRAEAETRAARLRARSPGSLYEARLARILGD